MKENSIKDFFQGFATEFIEGRFEELLTRYHIPTAIFVHEFEHKIYGFNVSGDLLNFIKKVLSPYVNRPKIKWTKFEMLKNMIFSDSLALVKCSWILLDSNMNTVGRIECLFTLIYIDDTIKISSQNIVPHLKLDVKMKAVVN